VPVRPATPADLPEIAVLIRELAEYEALVHEVVWTEDELARALFGDDPSAHVLVAETDDGEVVGLAIWFRTFSTFLGRSGIWLEDLFVRPEHRGGGHGRALLEALRGLTDGRVEWAVLDWNEPAIGFYRSIGAHPVEGWTRYRWVLE
jgi:GNAT superfamily N-acetyltransferase